MPVELHMWPLLLRGKRHSLAVALLICVISAPALAGEPSRPEQLRLGFSYSMFTHVNENDAKASLRALSAVISRERSIPANPDPMLFRGTDSIAAAVRAREIDSVTLTTDEYWTLANDGLFDRCLLAIQNGDPAEEYVMLTRVDSGLKTLGDLQHRRIAIHATPRMRLGYFWLEVLLARQERLPVATYFDHIGKNPKLARTVLDVFFRQADACLVTRRGLGGMIELNPQVGKQLQIIESSPPMVPALFALRAGIADDFIGRAVDEFTNLHETPTGQQVLTIFQVGRVAELPLSVLDGAMALLNEYAERRPAEAAAMRMELRHTHLGPIGAASP